MICPDLKSGLVFSNSNNKGEKYLEAEIIAFDEKTLTVKVLFCNDKYFSRYLQAGETYIAELDGNWEDMKVWVISNEQMTGGSSVISVAWNKTESGGNFNWDLDS